MKWFRKEWNVVAVSSDGVYVIPGMEFYTERGARNFAQDMNIASIRNAKSVNLYMHGRVEWLK